jgi:hypothetical protein
MRFKETMIAAVALLAVAGPRLPGRRPCRGGRHGQGDGDHSADRLTSRMIVFKMAAEDACGLARP